MSYRDRTTGEALLTYDEDNPCPHCGRREVERGGASHDHRPDSG